MPDPSHTVCVIPWSQMVVRPNGVVHACCHAPVSAGSLYQSSLEEIWNGEAMVSLRSALGRGEAHPACNECWEQEGAGVRSPRQIANESTGFPGSTMSLEGLIAEGPRVGFRAAAAPGTYVLQLGNLCNLKCRSCNQVSSSRIASDVVHRTWSTDRIRPAWREHGLRLAPVMAPGVAYRGFDTGPARLLAGGAAAIEIPTEGSQLRALALRATSALPCRLRLLADGEVLREVLLAGQGQPEDIAVAAPGADRLLLRFEPGAPLELHALELRRVPARRYLSIVPAGHDPWFKAISDLATTIAKNPGGAMIFLLGGEPFLIDEVWELARELVARGLAKRLVLAMSTNCTLQREELARLAPEFRHVVLHLSIDGYGPMFEYLRHGARWPDLLQTLAWFRSLPNTSLTAFPTVQSYNALDAVRLFRFLDSQDIAFGHNLLARPERLRLLNLPPRVRRTAAARLRGYLERDCRPGQRQVVKAYVDILESAGGQFDPVLFHEFMLFTNDLDSTRNQRFADVAPDLAALIGASGVTWTADRHHA